MDENNDQNNQKSKASNLNMNVSTEPMNTQAENDFCSVPILQKVLVPAPGYQSRLYSVQVMRASDAEDYYRKIPGNSNHDIAAPNERERLQPEIQKPTTNAGIRLTSRSFPNTRHNVALKLFKMPKKLGSCLI